VRVEHVGGGRLQSLQQLQGQLREVLRKKTRSSQLLELLLSDLSLDLALLKIVSFHKNVSDERVLEGVVALVEQIEAVKHVTAGHHLSTSSCYCAMC
jgi:hypothetical protein